MAKWQESLLNFWYLFRHKVFRQPLRRVPTEEDRELAAFAQALVSDEYRRLGNRKPYCLDREMRFEEENADKKIN